MFWKTMKWRLDATLKFQKLTPTDPDIKKKKHKGWRNELEIIIELVEKGRANSQEMSRIVVCEVTSYDWSSPRCFVKMCRGAWGIVPQSIETKISNTACQIQNRKSISSGPLWKKSRLSQTERDESIDQGRIFTCYQPVRGRQPPELLYSA